MQGIHILPASHPEADVVQAAGPGWHTVSQQTLLLWQTLAILSDGPCSPKGAM